MANESLITDEMRARVGTASEPWVVELGRSMIRLFARAVGYSDPLYYDEEAARARGFPDLVAPPGYLGTPIFDPNLEAPWKPGFVTLPFVKTELNGGTEIEYFRPLHAGDRLEVRRRIISWTQVEGRLGPMVVVRSDNEYRDRGELVAVERLTSLLVARG